MFFFFASPKFFDSAQKKQSFDFAQEAPEKNYILLSSAAGGLI